MINILAISMLFTGQSLQMSPGGFGSTGLEARAKRGVAITGKLYCSSCIKDSVRVCSNVFDTEVKTKNFVGVFDAAFRFINSNDQIEPVIDSVIDKIGLSCFGKFDPIKFPGLVLTEDDRDSDTIIPESEADGVRTLESPEPGIVGDGRGGFEPMHFLFISFIGTTDNGNSSDHELSRDVCFFSDLMINEFLKGPFTESLVKESCLRDGVAGLIEESHSLQKESMLLRGRVQVYFY